MNKLRLINFRDQSNAQTALNVPLFATTTVKFVREAFALALNLVPDEFRFAFLHLALIFTFASFRVPDFREVAKLWDAFTLAILV